MKIYHLVQMLQSLGHEVFHYGCEDSEVYEWATDVPIITRKEQGGWFGKYNPDALYNVDWSPKAPYWRIMNERAAAEINKRKSPHDFVLVIAGSLNQPIEQMVGPDVMVVEFGCGYNGVFSKYRVFESYAHMHKIWGAQGGYDPDGKFYDAVIPNYLNPDDYPFKAEKQDYISLFGKIDSQKGYRHRRRDVQAAWCPAGCRRPRHEVACG
jgi:hypothetical protein